MAHLKLNTSQWLQLGKKLGYIKEALTREEYNTKYDVTTSEEDKSCEFCDETIKEGDEYSKIQIDDGPMCMDCLDESEQAMIEHRHFLEHGDMIGTPSDYFGEDRNL